MLVSLPCMVVACLCVLLLVEPPTLCAIRTCHLICIVLPVMKLEENAGSDRSWVYPCPADFADGEAKKEMFAIRLLNKESRCAVFSSVFGLL
jgi:RanBP1 domain